MICAFCDREVVEFNYLVVIPRDPVDLSKQSSTDPSTDYKSRNITENNSNPENWNFRENCVDKTSDKS